MEKLFIIILVPAVIYLVYYLLNKTHKNSKAIRRVLSKEGKAILLKKYNTINISMMRIKSNLKNAVYVF
ncbi:hypothetical protein BN1088_1500098 [Sphingobacterium sp. PM2-P1-29]|nr:hypothetical protein BN1088_1500098 [Sphingobacterium sp. PM2-P1-29]